MSKHLFTRKLLPVLIAFPMLLSLTLSNASDALTVNIHLGHRVTNVSDVAFTVSWTTAIPCKAYVEYGETPSLGEKDYDDRGQDTVSDTHHVSIGYLMPETIYYYDIICDDVRYDNGGQHYSVTTGPTIFPELPKPIYGQVLRADGQTPAEGSIVYIKIADNDGKGIPGTSQEWSRLVDSIGHWIVAFGTLRAPDLQSWFEFDQAGGDNILLEFDGAADGKASLTVPTALATQRLPSVTLLIAE